MNNSKQIKSINSFDYPSGTTGKNKSSRTLAFLNIDQKTIVVTKIDLRCEICSNTKVIC